MKRAPRDWLIAAALIAGAAAYLLPLRPYGLMINDDGWYLHPVLRMLAGEVLYRDVVTFYAPLRHHVFEWLFWIAGPSLLLARTLWVVILVTTVALTYRVALRLVPWWLAWLPAAVYGLVPGPWHKAPYGFCTVLYLLMFTRALERPLLRRFAGLGAVAGLTLVTRQDLGLLQLAISLGGAAIAALAPVRFGATGPATAARAAGGAAVTLAGFAIAVAPVAAYYAYHGALGALIDSVFVRAFGQMGMHQSGLVRLLSPATFATAAEGRAVGIIMLAPLVVYGAAAVALARRLSRSGANAESLFLAAILAFGAASVVQTYHPMLLLRLLQGALPFYLLATFVALELAVAVRGRVRGIARPIAAIGIPTATAVLAAVYVWLVIAGIPSLRPADGYSGSLRARSFADPVEVMGDTIYVDWPRAEEIRLIRAYVEARCGPAQPVLALPLHASYYLLLERPNPTRILGEHYGSGDYVLSDDDKRKEMSRLLASETCIVLVDRTWLAWPEPPERLRRTLLRTFHPVRWYGSMVILERGSDDTTRRLAGVLRRFVRAESEPADAEALREIIRERPGEPLAHELRGQLLRASGDAEGAIAAFAAAAQLDPLDPINLERAAALRLEQGRVREAARDLRRVRRVREGPIFRELWSRIPPRLRNAGAGERADDARSG